MLPNVRMHQASNEGRHPIGPHSTTANIASHCLLVHILPNANMLQIQSSVLPLALREGSASFIGIGNSTRCAKEKPPEGIWRLCCLKLASVFYRLQPSRYSRCTNWFTSSIFVLFRFFASHSMRLPSLDRIARLPTRMVSVRRPA